MERRASIRHRIRNMPALLVRRLGSPDIEEAIVRDLGGGGACLATEISVPVGSEIYVGFFLGGAGEAPVVAKAAVAWAKRDRESVVHTLGLVFVHAGAAQRQAIETLRDFLARRQAALAASEPA